MYALLKREVKHTQNHICISDTRNNWYTYTYILIDLYKNLNDIKKYLKPLKKEAISEITTKGIHKHFKKANRLYVGYYDFLVLDLNENVKNIDERVEIDSKKYRKLLYKTPIYKQKLRNFKIKRII